MRGDYAEAVDAAGGKERYEPGDVLVLTSDGKGDVEKSSEPYSTMVAGVFATKPGVIGKRQSLSKDADDLPMAMVGIVPAKVSAENGSIRRGDLLVSSSRARLCDEGNKPESHAGRGDRQGTGVARLGHRRDRSAGHIAVGNHRSFGQLQPHQRKCFAPNQSEFVPTAADDLQL